MTMNTIPRRKVGRTALEVTRIGLGTAFLLGLDTVGEEAPAIATVRAALAQGINFIDTAALYSRGQAERVIGDALQGVPRDRFVIQTKAGRFSKPEGGSYHDYSRDAILRSVENSMKLLRVDRLDSVLVHDATNTIAAKALAWKAPTFVMRSITPSRRCSSCVARE